MVEGAGQPVTHRSGESQRSVLARVLLAGLLLLLFVLFVSLGTWQVQRRAWKLDLIARVENRIHGAPVAAPLPAQWPHLVREQIEYQPIRLRGTFQHDLEAFVQANSIVGGGYWVVTPLQTERDGIVLINRGFVPSEYRQQPARAQIQRPAGLVEITGLVRMTEPKGAFLHSNRPTDDRWYSRDVHQIAQARHLSVEQVAPYFVDQTLSPRPLDRLDAPVVDIERWIPPPEGEDELAVARWLATQRKLLPMPGLTVVSFHNSHLAYILTWYGLALLVLFAAWKVFLAPTASRERAG